MKDEYRDILDLPHHTSPRHPRMSRQDRAAQFAPFSALTGYDDVIDETARVTDSRIELSEEARDLLDMKQRILSQFLDSYPEITVTYFLPDTRKAGGAYQSFTGNLKRIDTVEQYLLFTDGKRIPLQSVLNIDFALWRESLS
jgi:hypothetical protein